MQKNAIIMAMHTDQRRSLSRRVGPLELFDQLHYCADLQQLRSLLEHLQPRLICCATDALGDETLGMTASLASLARKHSCPLVFFGSDNPEELFNQGLLPPGSHCFDERLPAEALKGFLQQIIDDSTRSRPPTAVSDSQDSSTSGPSPAIHNRFSFVNFLVQEKSRSQLTGRPYALLTIEPHPGTQPPQQGTNWEQLVPDLASQIVSTVRNSDLLCHIDQRRLALLMPETSAANAALVKTRIEQILTRATTADAMPLKVDLSSVDTLTSTLKTKSN